MTDLVKKAMDAFDFDALPTQDQWHKIFIAILDQYFIDHPNADNTKESMLIILGSFMDHLVESGVVEKSESGKYIIGPFVPGGKDIQ